MAQAAKNQFTSYSAVNNTRMGQQGVAPSAIRQRNFLQPIVETPQFSGQFTLPDPISASNRAFISINTASQTQSSLLGAEIYFSIYQDAIDGANLIPGGSATTDTDYNIVGPFFDLFNWTGNLWETQWAVSFSNLTGGTHTFFYIGQVKYLSNAPGVI